MQRRKSSLSPYHVLLVIGTAMAAVDGKVYALQFSHDKKDSGYPYSLLKKMEEFGFLKAGGYGTSPKGSGLCRFYELTEKGRRFGLEYSARTIAANPRLVPFEEFN